MHFIWEETLTYGNQTNTFYIGQRVNSHFEKMIEVDTMV